MLCVQQTTENGSFASVLSQTKWLNLCCLVENITHMLKHSAGSRTALGVFRSTWSLPGPSNLALVLPHKYKHCDTVVGCRRKGTCNVLFHLRQQRHWISLHCMLKLLTLLLWDSSFTICNICGYCTSTESLHVSCKAGKTIILPNTEWPKNNGKYLTVSFE